MTINELANINSNLHLRRARNQPVQKEVRYSPVPAREAIDKMTKILDCIHDADIRINAIRETAIRWHSMGCYFSHQLNKFDVDIENTKAAKLKLKKYFNKISRSIELFNLK